jgi:signal transduction histidine kinase
VLDAQGWVLADSGPLDLAPVADPDTRPSLIERFFRSILRREDPEYAETLLATPGRIQDPALLRALDGENGHAWYRRGTDVSAIVAASVPIDPNNPGRGAVVIEQASDSILSVANQEMLRLITTTIVVSLVAAAALLAYASLLSFRVRRLARAAETALGPRGEISIRLPGAKASDEIGDLSRSFQDLLGRLRDYTDYLQSLKSKLSHELRTPLAIVATSVDNLEHEISSEAGAAYLTRLRQGATRLESILQAMTAATRVGQAINQSEFERVDLTAVVGTCLSSYRDVYPTQKFSQQLPQHALFTEGSADLIAQLFDKLIDNAVGFAAEGTAIEVSLTASQKRARLEVVNRGPLLPEAMRHQLFDSLVSVRESGGDKPHLGLGLYIVMLIAEFHRGQVAAENLADGSGVSFVVELPCSDAG